MKKIIIFIFAIAVLNSCCTKKYCISYSSFEEVVFGGFSTDEIDSVTFVMSTSNSIQTKAFYKENIEKEGNAYKIKFLTDEYNFTKDYTIEVYANSKYTYNVNNFVIETKNCNTGLFCHDEYTTLKSFEINGKITHLESLNASLLLEKP